MKERELDRAEASEVAVAAEPLLEARVHRSPATAEAEELPAHGPDHCLLEGLVREGPFRHVKEACVVGIKAAPKRPHADQYEEVLRPVEGHHGGAIGARIRPILADEFDAFRKGRVHDALGGVGRDVVGFGWGGHGNLGPSWLGALRVAPAIGYALVHHRTDWAVATVTFWQ